MQSCLSRPAVRAQGPWYRLLLKYADSVHVGVEACVLQFMPWALLLLLKVNLLSKLVRAGNFISQYR